ncbi:MAG TPA: GerMN domain-containing protein [Acidimicrobiia bacterium]|nr:GerMN domain-containing protein [Acidimicrobiia bacterium]
MKRLTILFVALALLFAACGGGDDVGDAGPVTTGDGASAPVTTTTQAPVTTLPSDPAVTTTTVPEATQFVDVYFLQDGQYATAVATRIPTTPDVAANAIRALIAGPTATQQEIGLSSSVPTDTLLLGITIENGLATVDLSREFEAGGGSFAMITRLAQVVYTMTQFPSVDEVVFWLDGAPVTVFSSEGLLLEEPVSRDDYLAAVPLTPTVLDDIPRWEQADLPAVAGNPDARRVVLVAEDDVLNVRLAPGVSNEIIGMLAPDAVVIPTGPQAQVGSSTWIELVTPAGAGWVNGHFLADAAPFDAATFPDGAVLAVIQEMSEIMAARGDLSAVVHSRGLYVSHHEAPIRFTAEELTDVLTDPTTYKWPSNTLNVNDPDEAKEIPDRTFTQAVGDRFVSTWDDPDRVTTANEPIEGGNGRIAEYAIPFELKGFNYVGVYDPGDNPDYGGLDWTIWYVSIDYEDGQPVVAALTLDEWAP